VLLIHSEQIVTIVKEVGRKLVSQWDRDMVTLRHGGCVGAFHGFPIFGVWIYVICFRHIHRELCHVMAGGAKKSMRLLVKIVSAARTGYFYVRHDPEIAWLFIVTCLTHTGD
jgi:hypothetical protein